MYSIIWHYLMKRIHVVKCGLLYKLFCTCKENHYDAAWSSNKSIPILLSSFCICLVLGGFFGGGQCILKKCRGWVFVILAEIMAQLDIWTDAFSDIRKAWFQISELEEGWGAGFFFLSGNKNYILAIFI